MYDTEEGNYLRTIWQEIRGNLRLSVSAYNKFSIVSLMSGYGRPDEYLWDDSNVK